MPAIPPTLVIPQVIGASTLLATVGWPIVLAALGVVVGQVVLIARLAIAEERRPAARERERQAVLPLPRPVALPTSR